MKLNVNDIHKKFGDKEVLKGATFEFEKGKIYGLLGRNGAGSFGFHPVLYDDRSAPHNLFERNEKIKPDFPYSYVRNWKEFTELLGNF